MLRPSLLEEIRSVLTEVVLSLSVPVWATLAAIFVLGGIVKGVVGVGLPLVLIPLLAPFLDMPVAVALLTVPMIATNIGQAAESGHTFAVIRRLAPMLLMLVIGTLLG